MRFEILSQVNMREKVERPAHFLAVSPSVGGEFLLQWESAKAFHGFEDEQCSHDYVFKDLKICLT